MNDFDAKLHELLIGEEKWSPWVFEDDVKRERPDELVKYLGKQVKGGDGEEIFGSSSAVDSMVIPKLMGKSGPLRCRTQARSIQHGQF